MEIEETEVEKVDSVWGGHNQKVNNIEMLKKGKVRERREEETKYNWKNKVQKINNKVTK